MLTISENFKSTMLGQRSFLGYVFLLSVSVSCYLYFSSDPWHFTLDDAYIVIDNAHTLLSGGVDDSFGQNALVGTTSAVHLISVAFLGLFLDLEVSAFIAVAAFAALYHIGIARLSMQIYPSNLIALLAVCLSIFVLGSLRQIYGGLETGLAMAAVVWCLSLFLSDSRILLPLVCGVMPFIRPELTVLALGVLAWRWYEVGFKRNVILRDIALFVAGAVPWLASYYLATGHFSSQTGSAKVAFFAEDGLAWFTKLERTSWATLNSGISPLLVCILFVAKTRFAVPALVFVCAFVGAYFLFFPGGLSHNYSRYLYVLLPIGLVGLIVLLKQLRITHPLAIFSIFAVLLFVMPPQIAGLRGNIYWSERGDNELVARATELLPADARVLIHDAGHFAWETSFETFDLVGLKTPSSILAHEMHTRPSNGHNRSTALDKIARDNQITHFIGLKTPFWEDMARGLEKEGWVLTVLHEPEYNGFVIYEINKPIP